jgi:hypothetical protein
MRGAVACFLKINDIQRHSSYTGMLRRRSDPRPRERSCLVCVTLGGRVTPSPAPRRLTVCGIAGCVGHASVHCDSGPLCLGVRRACALCVSQQQLVVVHVNGVFHPSRRGDNKQLANEPQSLGPSTLQRAMLRHRLGSTIFRGRCSRERARAMPTRC